MSQVTLEKIEKKQSEILELIQKFKTELKTAFIFPSAEIELAHGEHYAGLIIGKDGEQSYHLILCAGENEKTTWQGALDWAESIGFELPNRREQALLYANLKEQFSGDWYWSNTQHASASNFAWVQHFGNGSQDYLSEGGNYRARAVRRLVIE